MELQSKAFQKHPHSDNWDFCQRIQYQLNVFAQHLEQPAFCHHNKILDYLTQKRCLTISFRVLVCEQENQQVLVIAKGCQISIADNLCHKTITSPKMTKKDCIGFDPQTHLRHMQRGHRPGFLKIPQSNKNEHLIEQACNTQASEDLEVGEALVHTIVASISQV